MVFKIVAGVMDSLLSCNFIGSHSVIRGNRYKLKQKHEHYNLSIWNSLSHYVVSVVSAC